MTNAIRHAPTAARLLLGFVFFTMGLDGFLGFVPKPPLEGASLAFIGALVASGYVMPVVKAIEVVAGALLLGNRFVPLALALLAPILVAITGYHIVVAQEGVAVALVLLALEVSLAWAYRRAFAPMLQARVVPSLSEGAASDPRASQQAGPRTSAVAS